MVTSQKKLNINNNILWY